MRYLALFLFCILVTSNAYAGNEVTETYKAFGMSCDAVIKAHSRFSFEGGRKLRGDAKTWELVGYIRGYMTAKNRWKSGQEDWFKGKNPYDLVNWVASYCRSNPSDELHDALEDFSGTALENFIPDKQ